MPHEVSADARRTPSVYNVANALTLLRLLLIPVFAWCVVESAFVSQTWRMAAAGVFALASATDVVDGWLARRHGLVTAFGKVADPIADKALTGTALILLSLAGQVPWWATALILFREIGVTVLRFWVIRFGVIAASHGGKLKTALQVAAIFWYLWPWPAPVADAAPWLMGAAVLATVVTGAEYVIQVIRIRHRGDRRSD
ncbi:CDP-diacylglycerol--glycerol-3-phosphate 3-phosphatidyltransferase [Stackebrandtia albiflava]|uniref:CDP-diacylglycerol--glycerol-3-phosphate 3-phosphatidyltransferase n=1 Tax=Stackebrandtia albiflava TaxID=406432 RepID=A0A562VGX2_9ACTN|nr:CDP-diacylglycerol--glycerol-3-phosphate 3-phosphatidyltransferase [Stackebrandtia albiflava]TWJ17145.1 CDP-diacylglycerol--glycerol-3-phosphate 3-phosphatidyltransferase [Stackebrandtia albiflava]